MIVGIQLTYLSVPSDNFLRSSSWFILCYWGNLLQSIRLYPFWARPPMCQWPCTTLPVMLCHSEWHLECLPFFSPYISFFSSFFWSAASTPEAVSIAAESSSLEISSSLCCYHYQCYTPSFGLFFFQFFFGFPYPGVASGLVLCARCTLPYRNCRLLHSCCVKWPFCYPIRWFP